MAKSKISWTERVWNPIRGCSKVSEGCRNCYAERMAGRFCKEGQPYHGLVDVDPKGRLAPRWTGEARFIPEMLDAPLRWKKPSTIFVNSMSDLFHESVTFEQIAAVYGIIAACPQHTFQVLTKRPKRMVKFYEWIETHPHWSHPMQDALCEHPGPLPGLEDDTGDTVSREVGGKSWPLPNLHLGVSIENQTHVERIEHLRQCPAAIRWVSLEPLLGPVDLRDHLHSTRTLHVKLDIAGALRKRSFEYFTDGDGKQVHPVTAEIELRKRLERGEKYFPMCDCANFDPQKGCEPIATPRIDWVVVGGESGPNARPIHPEWVRSIRGQCKEANVPYWFKQWGEWNVASVENGCSGSIMPESGSLYTWLGIDGKTSNPSFHGLKEPVYAMQRVGKKTAGNLLDGVRYEMRPGDSWK